VSSLRCEKTVYVETKTIRTPDGVQPLWSWRETLLDLVVDARLRPWERILLYSGT